MAPDRMARNVEIKARVTNPLKLYARARALADTGPVELMQDDTFFHCPSGRLKLRVLSESEGQLIFYERANSLGPKESRYVIWTTSSPDALRARLTAALGERGRVRKKRTLFLCGNTRIHCDEVEGLGSFMELEVVLADGEAAEDGIAIARRIMAQLGVSERQLVDTAYVDLLADRDCAVASPASIGRARTSARSSSTNVSTGRAAPSRSKA